MERSKTATVGSIGSLSRAAEPGVARISRPGADRFSKAGVARLPEADGAAGLPSRFDLLESCPLSVALNLALDHAVAESVAGGVRPAAVRLWNWSETAAVIGSSQSLSNEIDVEAAKKRGIALARRASGGGTMYMDPARAVAYSVIVPSAALSGLSLRESYALCDSWVLRALKEMGVPAFYMPINDIATLDGKIGGAAQRRLAGGATVHHAVMSWEIETEQLLAVTRLFRPDTGARGTKSAQKKVVGIRSYVDAAREDVIDALRQSLARGRTVRRAKYRPDELIAAESLAKAKFADPAWLARIP